MINTSAWHWPEVHFVSLDAVSVEFRVWIVRQRDLKSETTSLPSDDLRNRIWRKNKFESESDPTGKLNMNPNLKKKKQGSAVTLIRTWIRPNRIRLTTTYRKRSDTRSNPNKLWTGSLSDNCAELGVRLCSLDTAQENSRRELYIYQRCKPYNTQDRRVQTISVRGAGVKASRTWSSLDWQLCRAGIWDLDLTLKKKPGQVLGSPPPPTR